MCRILIAFDFGTKNIGVAVGERITGRAYPLTAIKARNGTPNWLLISRLLNIWEPDKAVVGLPLNMEGEELPLAPRAKKFAKKIRSYFGLEVELHDERLSTSEARLILFEYAGLKTLKKRSIDSISAVIILESFFAQNF